MWSFLLLSVELLPMKSASLRHAVIKDVERTKTERLV
jgi:hypothetical protein